MPDAPTSVSSTGNALTDGTGVSRLLASKVIKDAVADLLLSLPPIFIGLHITGLDGALAAPTAVAIGVGDAVIRWLYRGVLRWATS